MKRLSALTAGVCLTAMLGFGHVMDIVRVTLPHAATVGSRMLPAGEYTIRGITNENSSSSTLQIRSAAGATYSVVATRVYETDSKRAYQTEIVLRRAGDNYQLDKIWLEGQDYGYELLP
jgi:hypothetical protein